MAFGDGEGTRRFTPQVCGCCTSRRGLLGAIAGGAAVAAAPAGFAAPAVARPTGIVDVHSHYAPPRWVSDLQAANIGMGPMNMWNLNAHLDAMGTGGVARSVLSITAPGIPFDGEKGRAMARNANDYGAQISRDHPKELALFACLPLNDVEGSLAELTYALDVLKAPGVTVFTSYKGKYIGDKAFDPIWEELNRRNAIVYIHPNLPNCCSGVIPYLNVAMIEFGTDTTRAITNYVYTGAAMRFPKVKMIWSHAGGTLPFLIERYDINDATTAYPAKVAPGGFRSYINKFFYDTAQSANAVAQGALKKVVPTTQVVFGTDYPYRTPLEHVQTLQKHDPYTQAELAGIYRGNVARAMPSLLA